MLNPAHRTKSPSKTNADAQANFSIDARASLNNDARASLNSDGVDAARVTQVACTDTRIFRAVRNRAAKRRAVVLGLGTAVVGSVVVGGCNFRRRHAKANVPRANQSRVVQTSYSGGTQVGESTIGSSTNNLPYQVSPAFHDAAMPMAPPSAQSPRQLLDAWDRLGSSHLRILQDQALQSAGSSNVSATDSSGAEVRAVGGPNLETRLLLKKVADAYVDVRYNLERMQDLYANLQLQEEAVAQAKRRKAEGKAGRLDVVQSQSAVGLTKSMMAPIRSELQATTQRLAALTGGELSPSLLEGITKSPQLRFTGLERRIPASILRQRHDVRRIEREVIAMGVQAGIPEVTLMPHLSLQGELTAKLPAEGKDTTTFRDSLDLNLGGADTWSFSVPTDAHNGGGVSRNFSPIATTMKGFQSTVYSAADQVESLLTEYHRALADVEQLETTQKDASETARLALQQFQVDRIDGSYVTNAQVRRTEAGQALAQSKARLASIAAALLVATGGECYPDKNPESAYQN